MGSEENTASATRLLIRSWTSWVVRNGGPRSSRLVGGTSDWYSPPPPGGAGAPRRPLAIRRRFQSTPAGQRRSPGGRAGHPRWPERTRRISSQQAMHAGRQPTMVRTVGGARAQALGVTRGGGPEAAGFTDRAPSSLRLGTRW